MRSSARNCERSSGTWYTPVAWRFSVASRPHPLELAGRYHLHLGLPPIRKVRFPGQAFQHRPIGPHRAERHPPVRIVAWREFRSTAMSEDGGPSDDERMGDCDCVESWPLE